MIIKLGRDLEPGDRIYIDNRLGTVTMVSQSITAIKVNTTAGNTYVDPLAQVGVESEPPGAMVIEGWCCELPPLCWPDLQP